MEHLLRDIKDTTVSTLAERVSEKLNSLKGLKKRLEEIHEYSKFLNAHAKRIQASSNRCSAANLRKVVPFTPCALL